MPKQNDKKGTQSAVLRRVLVYLKPHLPVLALSLLLSLIAVALTLFAYSTILGWSLYGSRCVQYLLGLRAAKVYQLIFVIVIVVGSVSSLDFVWNIADTLNGLMAIPNFIALFALSPVIFRITREHFRGVDLASARHE